MDEKNNDFDNLYKCNLNKDIFNKLDNLYNNSIIDINNLINEYKEKYKKFKNIIEVYLNEKAKNVIKIFNLKNNLNVDNKELDNYFAKIIINIKNIINLYENVIENTKNNINLLNIYLEIYKYLDNENSFNFFINYSIENTKNIWIFQKLELNKYKNVLELFDIKNLDDNLIDYILSCNENDYFNVDIKNKIKKSAFEKSNFFNSSEEVLLNNYKKIKLNSSKIKNLKIYNDNLKKYNESMALPNLESLSLKNSNLPNEDFYFEMFENLNYIKIKNCKFNNIEIFNSLTTNLKEIYLINLELINSNFNIIMDYFTKKEECKNTLEILSFKKNDLSNINFETFCYKIENCFTSLKEIDLSENKIFHFNINIEYFPNLKYINCSKNNFSKSYYSKFHKKILFLQDSNIFLTNNDLRNNYILYLSQILNNFDYPIKNISFSFLFNKNNINKLIEFNFNNIIKASLKFLNLSYCGFNNENIIKFFEKNGFINLENLNLCGNYLSDNFFKLFINNKIYFIMNKLKIINLKNNDFDCEDFSIFIEFLKLNKNLQKVNLNNNPFPRNYSYKKLSNDLTNFKKDYNLNINILYKFNIINFDKD